jgi:hypothetical protein
MLERDPRVRFEVRMNPVLSRHIEMLRFGHQIRLLTKQWLGQLMKQGRISFPSHHQIQMTLIQMRPSTT